VRPMVEISRNAPVGSGSENGAAMQVGISSRDRLDVQPVNEAPVTVNVTGEANIDSEARYQRFTLTIPAGTEWEHAMGMIAYKSAMGRYDGYSVA